jgi:hypothetical protein
LSAADANPRLPRFALGTMISVCIGVILGLTLLVPEFSIPRWPWEIKPFNARFIGIFYLAAWLGAIYVAVVGRRSPALAFARDAATFTSLATLASLIHRDQFVSERPLAVAVWWIAYVGFSAALIQTVRLLSAGPEPGQPASPSLSRLMQVYALITAVYGLALFMVPATATAFWPWPVDAFHARVYSGIFISGTVLILGLRRNATAMDLKRAGLQQAVLGLGAIWATWSVDLTAQRVDWSAGGTLLWLALFGGVGLAGLAMVMQGMRRGGA